MFLQYLKVSKSRHTVFIVQYVYGTCSYSDIFCTIALAVYHAAFGQGTGPVFLRYLNCTGRESSLLSCSHRSGSCSHSVGAGVVCPPCKL